MSHNIIRHSRAGGNPALHKWMDPRFLGDDDDERDSYGGRALCTLRSPWGVLITSQPRNPLWRLRFPSLL